MPKVIEIRTEPAICSIPLHQAIYRAVHGAAQAQADTSGRGAAD